MNGAATPEGAASARLRLGDNKKEELATADVTAACATGSVSPTRTLTPPSLVCQDCDKLTLVSGTRRASLFRGGGGVPGSGT